MLINVVTTNLNTWALEIAGFSAAVIILYKMFKRYENTTKAIEDAKKFNSFMESMSGLPAAVEALTKEFKPNGGSSLKDAINRLEQRAANIETSLAFGQVAIKSFTNTENEGYVITNELGETIEVSLSVCRMLGRTEDELKGFKYFSYIHPDDAKGMKDGIDFALENHTNMNKDCRMLLPGKTKTYININNFAQRIEANGHFKGYYIKVTKI